MSGVGSGEGGLHDTPVRRTSESLLLTQSYDVMRDKKVAASKKC